jgi:3-hydroxymyristoyl/3-hydroxydecanoyl-(acyl carrier protein) dehydratase
MNTAHKYQPDITRETRDDGCVRLALHLPPDLDFFRGHFPQWPVLPGVVQVHWAITFTHRYFGEPGIFVRIDNLKFHRVLAPNADIELELRYDAAGRHVDFCYASAADKYSSGRVVFKEGP